MTEYYMGQAIAQGMDPDLALRRISEPTIAVLNPREYDLIWNLHRHLGDMNGSELLNKLQQLTPTTLRELFLIFNIKGPTGI